MQGFTADPVYAKGEVFAYGGLPQNLKDLKDLRGAFCRKEDGDGRVGWGLCELGVGDVGAQALETCWGI